MKYLFLFTIPSVQDFISKARKTHDLYAASQIFSDLMEYVAKEIFVKKYKGHLIFPLSNFEQFTNRFLGFLEAKDEDKIKEIGNNLIAELKNKWVEDTKLRLKTFILCKGNEDEKCEKSIYEINRVELPIGTEEQLKDVFEPKWAAIECDDKDETYPDTYKKLERIIGGIKNHRKFSQYHYQIINGEKIYGEKGRKCSVDGIRNVKFYRLTERELASYQNNCNDAIKHLLSRKLFFCEDNDKQCLERNEAIIFLKSIWDKNREKISNCGRSYIQEKINDRFLAPGEGLSAVSMVKRLYNQPQDFPSTSEISLLSVFKKAKSNADLLNNLFNLRSKFRLEADKDYLVESDKDYLAEALHIKGNREEKLEFNYHWFYKENQKEAESILDADTFELLEKITKRLKDNFGELPRYYAIVAFDGDSMGKQLSKVNKIIEHMRISYALSEFSKKVKEVDYTKDTNKLARIVYSGGDDVLAFVNLEYLFDFLKQVRELYIKHTSKVAERYNGRFKFTISAGVAIAHYKTPLGIVLSKAREMEKKAKQNKDNSKDSFAIAVLKRSGEISDTVWKWEIENDKSNEEIYTTDIFTQLISYLRESLLSNNFIKNIQIEFQKVVEEKQEAKEEEEIKKNIVLTKIIKAELKRLMQRSRNKEKLDENSLNDLLEKLYLMIDDTDFDLNNFFKALNIADFIQRNYTKEKENKDGK